MIQTCQWGFLFPEIRDIQIHTGKVINLTSLQILKRIKILNFPQVVELSRFLIIIQMMKKNLKYIPRELIIRFSSNHTDRPTRTKMTQNTMRRRNPSHRKWKAVLLKKSICRSSNNHTPNILRKIIRNNNLQVLSIF